MTVATLIRVLALAALIALMPTAVDAQPSPCTTATQPVATADAAADELRKLQDAGCLGEAACTSSACEAVKDFLKATPTTGAVAANLRTVLGEAAKLDGRGDYRTIVLDNMNADIATFATIETTAAARWAIEDLRLFADQERHGRKIEVDIVDDVLAGCSGQDECTARFVDAQRLVTVANLFARVLLKAAEPQRAAFVAYLARLDAQWTAYLGAARGQYPWELLLNSALYRKTGGFDRPPTSQWIVAHPGVAFEVVRNGRDRNPSEVLLLELLGWQRWTWSEEGRPGGGRGGSLTLSWRDAGDGRRNLGYGALFYLPKGSTIGYVWRPQRGDAQDEHALVLSADLVKFFNDRSTIRAKLLGGQ